MWFLLINFLGEPFSLGSSSHLLPSQWIGGVVETNMEEETDRIRINPLKSTKTLKRPAISMAILNGRRK